MSAPVVGEPFKSSVAVTELTYIYWSLSLIRGSFADILTPGLHTSFDFKFRFKVLVLF